MNETGLSIRVFGDPVLRKKSKPVRQVTKKERDILSEMSRLMYESSGIGLAAPQVGISANMIVADIGSGLFKLINPKIVKKSGSQVLEEGCLSVPGVCIKVRRAGKVIVEALDDAGKRVNIEADELLACVLQHEIDHLKGKMIVDYASVLDKIRIAGKLAMLKKKSKKSIALEQKSCDLEL